MQMNVSDYGFSIKDDSGNTITLSEFINSIRKDKLFEDESWDELYKHIKIFYHNFKFCSLVMYSRAKIVLRSHHYSISSKDYFINSLNFQEELIYLLYKEVLEPYAQHYDRMINFKGED